jgi:hypothetical protein
MPRVAIPLLVLLALPLLACDSGDDATGSLDAGSPDAAPPEEKFSFFVTSLDTMRAQSGSADGFGGDLGGLAGADQICQTAAANVGFGHKTWRAFLSVAVGPDGVPVHAIDRVGDGPWYDRNGRLVAMDRAGLLSTRPAGDPQSVDDLPDEQGRGLTTFGDTHDILTGSNEQGMLDGTTPAATCQDWTSAVGPGSVNMVRCGHSWPAMSGQHWIRAHRVPGCAPGVRTTFTPPGEEGDTVGGQGGWGGIYCFALTP